MIHADASTLNAVLAMVILLDLALLGASRLKSCIRLMAMQGALVSVTPFLAYGSFSWQLTDLYTAFFCLLAFGAKAVIFPWFLLRTLRRVGVRHDIEPYISYPVSLLLGLAGLLLALWLPDRLELHHAAARLALPASLTTMLAGFVLVVGRRKALTQVIGYLAAENGIFLFGATMAEGPLWLELCILLDVVVGVLVMGVAINHIKQAFDSIDVNLFSTIRD